MTTVELAQRCLDGADIGMPTADLIEDMMHEIVHLERDNANLQLQPAELATICCALGHWEGSSASAPSWVHDLGYGHRPLTVGEIEALIKRLQPDTPDNPYEDGETERQLQAGLDTLTPTP